MNSQSFVDLEQHTITHQAVSCQLRTSSSNQSHSPLECIGLVQVQDKEGVKTYATGILLNSFQLLTSATAFWDLSIEPGESLVFSKSNFVYFQVSGQLDGSKVITTIVKRTIISPQFKRLANQIRKLRKQIEDLKSQTTNKQNYYVNLEQQQLQDQLSQKQQEIKDYDYAIIKLNSQIQRKQYFSLKLIEKKEDTNLNITICSYLRKNNAFRLYEQRQSIKLNQFVDFYFADTNYCRNGSPIIISQSPFQVIGLLKSFDEKGSFNEQCLLTQKSISYFQEWANRGYSEFSTKDSFASIFNQEPKKQIFQELPSENRRLRQNLLRNSHEIIQLHQKNKLLKSKVEDLQIKYNRAISSLYLEKQEKQYKLKEALSQNDIMKRQKEALNSKLLREKLSNENLTKQLQSKETELRELLQIYTQKNRDNESLKTISLQNQDLNRELKQAKVSYEQAARIIQEKQKQLNLYRLKYGEFPAQRPYNITIQLKIEMNIYSDVVGYLNKQLKQAKNSITKLQITRLVTITQGSVC